MRNFFESIIVIGILSVAVITGSGCTLIEEIEKEKVLVIKDAEIDMEQSSANLEINEYEDFEEYVDAIAEIESKSYDNDYRINYVMFEMASSPKADITLEAEHIIKIAKYEHIYYILYDSFDNSREALGKIKEREGNGVIYAGQNKSCINMVYLD